MGAQVGTGILSLPRLASQHAAQDAWIAVILGAVVPMLSVLLIERMVRSFPQLNFVDLSQLLFGKIMGYVLLILFILYVIAFQSIVIRLFTEITSQVLLPRTPIAVINFMMVLAAVYVASKGVRVVGRMNELLFYILLLFFGILAIPAFTASHYTYILPIGDSGIVNIAKDTLPTAYAYSGVEILMIFYFLANRKEDVRKASILAVVLTALLYVFVTVLCLLVFGPDVLREIIWPVQVLLKVNQTGVVERLEIVFLTAWLALGARPAINFTCASAFSLSYLLRLDESSWYPRLVCFIGLMIFIGANIPADIIAALDYSNLLGYAFFLVALGYPLLYLLLAFLRRKELKSYSS